jgi:histidinol-phosphate aminotransferase
MTLSRRSFVRTLGLGSVGALTGTALAARGREAAIGLGLDPSARPDRARAIRLSSNENPVGPFPVALQAVSDAFGRAARYPDTFELTAALAARHDVDVEHIVVGCGSGEILRMTVHACTSRTRALVTASPTFEDPARAAALLDVEVRAVQVQPDLSLDLDGMAAQASGAGLVFVCNPNNPTGTLHSGARIRNLVRQITRQSPDTVVLIDEAYAEYVEDPAYESAISLATEQPNVVVSRTFSKLFGLAGARIGYAVGQPATVQRLRRHRLPNSVNVLGAAAALASVGASPSLVAQEVARNREAREFTTAALTKVGFAVTPSHTNFIMVDVKRPIAAFGAACRAQGIAIGRPFPPLTTHARISIGTLDEMRTAVGALTRLLAS